MSTIATASQQWASRPSDQRFESLLLMRDKVALDKSQSYAKTIPSRNLECVPVEGDKTGRGLQIVGVNGEPINLTNYSFGQLARYAEAPAGYLRELPGALAADCINYGIFKEQCEDRGVLVQATDVGSTLRAVTGPNYGRVWNESIVEALIDKFGDGISGKFRVPGEFGKKIIVTKANTTLYASDRDMFVFLADEEHRIEIKNRRNGQPGSLARGFFVWNSEVGAQSLGIATFLFDYVCSNRMVWGATEYQEIRFRHTKSAPTQWIESVVPAIESYANSSTDGVVKAVENARKARVENVDEFLLKRKFTGPVIQAIKSVHMTEEERPMENRWDIAVGVTAYARGITYQDERIKLEREAGKIMKQAA